MQGKVSPERSACDRVYVGVDVCKEWLDVYLHPVGLSLRVANTPTGLKRLKRELARHAIACVAVEATGKFHRLTQRHLHAAGIPVAVVNPLRSRLFCEASGQLAKTDAIDARLLAVMAESLNLRVTPPTPEIVEDLQELVRARAAAVADRTALINQRAAARLGAVKAELGRSSGRWRARSPVSSRRSRPPSHAISPWRAASRSCSRSPASGRSRRPACLPTWPRWARARARRSPA